MVTDRVRTSEMSWRDVEAAIGRGSAALVPMGSTEEHGPHAPTGDYIIADEVAEQVVRASGDVMVPTIPFSYSEYFRNYPGTITLQAETLRLIVKDVVYCLLDQGFKHVVLLNGHKGNEPVLLPLIRQIRRERGILIPVVAPLGFGLTGEVHRELYGDIPIGHGGEPIGSVMSYLHPELVNLDRAEDWGSKPFLGVDTAGLNGIMFKGRSVAMAINMEEVTPASGSLSDPLVASPERGQRIVENAVESLTEFMTWFKTVDPTVKP